MSASVLPVLVSGFASAEEAPRALPMPAIAFGVLAFVAFLIGLGVLWTFRNAAAKIPPPGAANDDKFHG
ncbi:MAG: hypothetical protein M3171_12485 [Actinomycetota bacterium]|nr:hypothetical protein [Actinomycetota bacterium]